MALKNYKIKLYVKRKWWGIEIRTRKHLVATASHRDMLLKDPLHFLIGYGIIFEMIGGMP